MDCLTETSLLLHLFSRGKVRNIYDLGKKLLIGSTDRISTFYVVHPTPIPERGKVLTALSIFWIKSLEEYGIVESHLLSYFLDFTSLKIN